MRRRSRLARHPGAPEGRVLALALALGPGLGCGARSWLPEGEAVIVDAAIPAVDGATCKGTTVPIAPRVPNLYFVLDVSGSMKLDDKWVHVQAAVSDLIFQLGASASFGVTIFPGAAGGCTSGEEVMPPTLGDALGGTQAAFLRATNLIPNGGTPTAATFRALLPRLQNLQGTTYVILATDGGPNCNSDFGGCGTAQCTRNIDQADVGCSPTSMNCCVGVPSGCLDTQASVDAVRALFDVGISTYVMGIPGSAPYAPVLEAMATAGGTARSTAPLYYAVDSSDRQSLENTFAEIADQAMRSCVLELEKRPGDPAALNVYVGGAVVPSDGADGWGLDGQTVTLRGASCATVQAGTVVPTLNVIEGCPTVH
ncbi:MAG: VWA domain-containing protein [Myxococcales bacterium]|nr:VWA domain-containing protein [Myxococcales bacterium]